MPATLQSTPDDIDLKALWQLAARSLPKLLVIGALAGALTFVTLAMVAPRYVAEAQVSIVSKSTNNPYTDPTRAGGSSDMLSVRMDKEAVNTHVRALMSQDLALTVARDMKLADKVEFNSALGAPDALSGLLRLVGIGWPRAGESDEERALNAYFARLEVYTAKESRVIGIRFSSSDPQLAAAIANRIAETYREMLARQTIDETDDVQKALAPKIDELAEEAGRAEADVEKFRGQANIFKGGQQATGLNEQQLAELNAELSRVKAARSEAEARSRQAREMLAQGSAETLPDVQKSAVVQALVQSRVRVERQISELSATLLPAHPRMRQLRADLAGLKTQLSAEVAKAVDGIGKEAKVAALREDAVNKSVSEIKARIVNTGPDEAKLRSLEANAKSKRAELDRLRSQFEANRVRADDSRAIPVELQIVSSARPSSTPIFPKKTASSVMVAVAMVVFGLAFVITRGLLTGARVPAVAERVPRRKYARQPMQVPELQVPELHVPEPQAREPQDTNSQIPELEVSQLTDLHATAAAASPLQPAMAADGLPREQRTTSLPNIAAVADYLVGLRTRALAGTRTLLAAETATVTLAVEAKALGSGLAAKGQTVILIDWAPLGGGISEILGQDGPTGMLELAAGTASFEQVIVALGDSGAHLIPAGRGDNAHELDADRINFVLDALDDVYNQIIVVARREAARGLFEAIQGRFDCGITLTDAKAKPPMLANGPETFLGYEVEGVELVSVAVEPAVLAKKSDRVVRATRQVAHAG